MGAAWGPGGGRGGFALRHDVGGRGPGVSVVNILTSIVNILTGNG
ncbi:MAG TPA: hypothetical protein VMV22_02250 [Acidimicrobiales bacterium]|nr:hypothetical protein [Acidimicrobiales bacterium]